LIDVIDKYANDPKFCVRDCKQIGGGISAFDVSWALEWPGVQVMT
jgi:hypothetical protein